MQSRRLLAILASLLASLVSSASAADITESSNLFRTGKYAECVDSAAKAIAEVEYNENFRLLKLRCELELGRYADAVKTLDAALVKFPTSIQLRALGADACRFTHEPARATKLEAEIFALFKDRPWFYTDAASQVTIGRLMLREHVDPKKVLDTIYNEAKRRQPQNIDVVMAIGDLAFGKHDYELAGDMYQQAVKFDPLNPDALLGVARAFAPSNTEKAEASLQEAIKQNPNHVDSLLMIVDEYIDSERYEDADKMLAQIAGVNPHQPQALAYRAVLAHLRNQPEAEQTHRAAALRHWTTNPLVDHTIGRKLSQKYRFAEGEVYQREALGHDALYLPAKSQLAQDLLRLGREEEGLKLAEEVYAEDGYNIFAHNLVTLEENLAKFRTLEEDGFLVRMDAREAEIYGPAVIELLKKAKQELCAKYDVKLPAPIIIEIFPKQQDFAIRTFGMPGGAGFLGVCFGTVITVNSPASQGTSPSCWAATLWHEFCHVVTLNKTHNKMPRWLSEGISVYEERQADRTWGQAMTPQYRTMILGDDLTPVSKLSGAFLNPKSPLHLQFAYYESSLVVEYLVEKYGTQTLQRVLVDLGAGLPINESLNRYTGSIDALDAEFAKYARAKATALAPEADWSAPELPRRASAEVITTWLKDHPNNYAGLRRLAEQLITEKKWQEAKVPLEKMRKLYPQDGSRASPLPLLAKVYKELKENKSEREVLNTLAELSASDIDLFDRLCELSAQEGNWKLTRQFALRSLAVNPLQAAPHRRAVAAAAGLADYALAARSYQALLLLDPFDPAEVHFQLATALKRQGDLTKAKRHALLALEETPRYRDAQQLLIEIVTEAEKKAKDSPTEDVRP